MQVVLLQNNAMFSKTKYQKLDNEAGELSSEEELFPLDNQHLLAKSDSISHKNQHEDVGLKKNVGIADGVSIVVGSMIGSGIFIVPTGVLKYSGGDMATSMVIWVIGGLIALFIALCFCELSTLIPESGGMAPFLKTIYGDAVCFVFLWIFLLNACPQGAAVQIIALG